MKIQNQINILQSIKEEIDATRRKIHKGNLVLKQSDKQPKTYLHRASIKIKHAIENLKLTVPTIKED